MTIVKRLLLAIMFAEKHNFWRLYSLKELYLRCMFDRILRKEVASKFFKDKAIVLIGPRQVGKTTLVKRLLEDKKFLFLDGDDSTVRDLLTNPNTEQIRAIIGNNDILFIDEAQRISNIGLTSKIITDQFKNVQLILSGSSSFEMNNQINEPLTGRKWEFQLLPIAWEEFENKLGYLKSFQKLENQLIYGFYPDVLNHLGEEKTVLKSLVDSYLYKDILSFHNIRRPEVLEKIVRALAFQIGNEISYNELSRTVGVDKDTVQKYIDILEKGFVVFRLGAYSRNLRNEIKSNKKIYFYDNGVRNAVIGNFQHFDSRIDKGALWENFLISERIKQNWYKRKFTGNYFWRTKQQQEVDYVEEIDGEVFGYEFKWKAKNNTRLPKTFTNHYNVGGIIDSKNFRDFIVLDPQ